MSCHATRHGARAVRRHVEDAVGDDFWFVVVFWADFDFEFGFHQIGLQLVRVLGPLHRQGNSLNGGQQKLTKLLRCFDVSNTGNQNDVNCKNDKNSITFQK
jgi:hypothetical protein